MANPFVPLPDEQRERAVNLIGPQLYRFKEVLFPGQHSITEASAVKESFLLLRSTVPEMLFAVDAKQSLVTACTDHGIWHHQLSVAGKIVGFAWADAEQTNLLGIMNGLLGPRLEEAVRSADARFDESYVTRMVLLTDIRCFVFIFTSPRDEWVMIISSPYSSGDLIPQNIRTPDSFAAALRSIHGGPAVVGPRV